MNRCNGYWLIRHYGVRSDEIMAAIAPHGSVMRETDDEDGWRSIAVETTQEGVRAIHNELRSGNIDYYPPFADDCIDLSTLEKIEK